MRAPAVLAVTLVALASVGPRVMAAGNEESAMQAPEIDFAPGPAYAGSQRMFQGIPSIAQAPAWRLWATWYGGGEAEGPENYIMAATSGDAGETWSDLTLVIDPSFRASEPALWCDPRGRMWLMWNQYPQGQLEPNSELWAVTAEKPDDEDPAWTEPRLLATELNCFNKPLVLSNGDWVWPAGSWHKPNPSRALLSHDDGATFVPTGPIVIPEQREFDEYNVVELSDGRLWLTCRTDAGIVESFSSDFGKTWTVAAPCAVQHAISRHFLTKLQSGKLLLIKHGPIDKQIGRSHLTAFLSGDDGKTWYGGLRLDERNDVSYPDGVQAADGTIYIIYDYERKGAKEILLARFTEKDVADGAWASEVAASRLLVNKATGAKQGDR